MLRYNEEFPADYWKELAEKRREALDISLTENEELHTSLASMKEEKELLEQVSKTFYFGMKSMMKTSQIWAFLVFIPWKALILKTHGEKAKTLNKLNK